MCIFVGPSKLCRCRNRYWAAFFGFQGGSFGVGMAAAELETSSDSSLRFDFFGTVWVGVVTGRVVI